MMKIFSLFLWITHLTLNVYPVQIKAFDVSVLKEGDILFQISKSNQSRAVQIVTRSKYSHMGMALKRKGKWMVLEAVQPAKYTPLLRWIKRGVKSHCVVKRLKATVYHFKQGDIDRIKVLAKSFVGKNYDIFFDWSDKQIYCSELVWKLYTRGLNVEIGKLEKFKDFNIGHPIVKKIVKKRFGNRFPLQMTVISPEAMFRSNLLYTVTVFN